MCGIGCVGNIRWKCNNELRHNVRKDGLILRIRLREVTVINRRDIVEKGEEESSQVGVMMC